MGVAVELLREQPAPRLEGDGAADRGTSLGRTVRLDILRIEA